MLLCRCLAMTWAACRAGAYCPTNSAACGAITKTISSIILPRCLHDAAPAVADLAVSGKLSVRPQLIMLDGALGEIRTPDPRNRNPMLYPAELRAHGPVITESIVVFNHKTEPYHEIHQWRFCVKDAGFAASVTIRPSSTKCRLRGEVLRQARPMVRLGSGSANRIR